MAIGQVLVVLCAVVALNATVSSAVNILCIMPVPSPSHHIWNRALINALAAQGHNMTVISADIETVHPANVHYIHLEKSYEAMFAGDGGLDLIAMANEGTFAGVDSFYAYGTKACEGAVASQGAKTLLAYPDDFHFDLVLYDFTLGPCILGFMHKFKYPPLVSISAFNNPPFTDDVIGGHKYPAYVPFYVLDYDKDMNYFQRMHNFLIYLYDIAYRHFVYLPLTARLSKELFGPNMPSGRELERRTTIMLVNAHESIDFAEPLPPNLIPVGGLQILDPKPLPTDMAEFIENGERGAILFSLGTNVRSDKLDIAKQKQFLDAFAQIPEYNFIWKFETQSTLTIPKNVMMRPWVPQSDVLAHPKVRLFITHSGLLSTQEASYHAVPMVGIPFFCDQHRNMFRSLRLGIAVRVPVSDISSQTILKAIQTVLHQPSYRQNVELLSQRFRDQMSKPLDRAVWWIEWVLRNPNPTHLRSPILDMGYLRGNSYDIFFSFAILLTVLVWIVYKVVGQLKNSSDRAKQSAKNKTE